MNELSVFFSFPLIISIYLFLLTASLFLSHHYLYWEFFPQLKLRVQVWTILICSVPTQNWSLFPSMKYNQTITKILQIIFVLVSSYSFNQVEFSTSSQQCWKQIFRTKITQQGSFLAVHYMEILNQQMYNELIITCIVMRICLCEC